MFQLKQLQLPNASFIVIPLAMDFKTGRKTPVLPPTSSTWQRKGTEEGSSSSNHSSVGRGVVERLMNAT